MKYARKVDGNQKEIIDGLRDVGATVFPLYHVGGGLTDLLVGYREKNFLLEIKNPNQPPSKRKLTKDQIEFHEKWRGQKTIVETIREALIAIGALKERKLIYFGPVHSEGKDNE